MHNGPTLWAKILAQFPTGSIIAGGAVRDFLLGTEPKDIDVFIPPYVPTPSHEVRFGLFRIDNFYARTEEYTALNTINCVSSGNLFDHTVDAIEMATPFTGRSLVETFDFGINWCWFDGQIHDEPEAQHDRSQNLVTLHQVDRLERSQARFERLNTRHCNKFSLHIPNLKSQARIEGAQP